MFDLEHCMGPANTEFHGVWRLLHVSSQKYILYDFNKRMLFIVCHDIIFLRSIGIRDKPGKEPWVFEK